MEIKHVKKKTAPMSILMIFINLIMRRKWKYQYMLLRIHNYKTKTKQFQSSIAIYIFGYLEDIFYCLILTLTTPPYIHQSSDPQKTENR